MTAEEFRQLHSELIRQVQGIEYDLKLIYAAIKPGDFDTNYREVQSYSLGVLARELRDLDYSDEYPDFTEDEYDFIDHIRVLRNYWCHQCYIDFMYIKNEAMREDKFMKIADQLESDEKQTRALFQKLESFRLDELERYGRI